MSGIAKAIGAAIGQLDEYIDFQDLLAWLNDDECCNHWHYYGDRKCLLDEEVKHE